MSRRAEPAAVAPAKAGAAGLKKSHLPLAAPASAGATGCFYAPPVKRSITIAGHASSLALEPLFWRALEAAAGETGLPLNALVARIDAERLEAPVPPNLASAIRCWLLARAGPGTPG